MAGSSSYYDPTGKTVTNGDTSDESDINDINTAVDAAFGLVEAEIDSLLSGAFLKKQVYTINPTGSMTNIPADGTTPQYTEGQSVYGAGFWGISYTPIYSGSTLIIEVDLNITISNINTTFDNTKPIGCIALFKQPTTSAIAVQPIVADVFRDSAGTVFSYVDDSIAKQYRMVYTMTTSSTSAIGFMVRVGPSSTSDFSFTVRPTLASFYGAGIYPSDKIIISEYKA